jgi:3-hydroxyacyl-CoA dehydrogenase/enoyl-CoA hydratase/3-hydroxybutyryl-CoA epimerase
MAMSSQPAGTSWRCEHDARGVWTLWFDQSEHSQNVLNRTAFEELDSQLDKAQADSSTTGLVIRSGRPEGFCAGADLRTILAYPTTAQVEDLLVRGLAVFDRLASLPFPTAAVIHGLCLGGGLELALACRWRVALASAAPLQIGLPEVSLGLVPPLGALVRLPRLIGPDDALDLLISGRSIGYLLARSLGIVDRLAAAGDPPESFDPRGWTPRQEPTFSEESWVRALDRSHVRLDDQPGDHPEVQARILSLVKTDVADGPEAARRAAVQAFAELVMSGETRNSIESSYHHGQSSPRL